jgi:ribosomal-protein-alanine N-acetyltransferase
VIARAAAAHAPAMAAIHAAAFPPGERWGADAFGLQLGLPGVFGLLDERGGMLLARVAAGEAEILTLAVHPAARRRGIAGALLGEAALVARAAGAVELFLEVSAANAAALALYKAAGFATVGRRAAYYADRSDALVQRRALA